MLTEGRKENLIDKYGNEDLIKDYLENSQIQNRTNFKYADWYLKQYYEIGSDIDRIEDGDVVLSKFDKYRTNLEKKDINQYGSFEELSSVIDEYETKRKPSVDNTESVKIVDNDEISIVRPLTHQASCKYGSGTKWCTTHKDSSYYERYTGKGNLYYVHLKTVPKSEIFYKMAIYLTFDGTQEEWYDAVDTKMRDNEVKLAKLLIKPESMELIKNDLQTTIDRLPKEKTDSTKMLEDVASVLYADDRLSEFRFNVDLSKYKEEDCEFDFEVNLEETVNNETISYFFNIGLVENIGTDFIVGDMVVETQGRDRLKVTFKIQQGNGVFESLEGRNFAFIVEYTKGVVTPQELVGRFFKVVKLFAKRIMTNSEVLTKFLGKKFWRPENRQSTYTFTGRGDMTKKFRDYMDNLGPEGLGSKIDFFLSIGRIKQGEDGQYLFARDNTPVAIGGYFSTFFASLKNAGIIEYVRQGRRYMFKQGPNYKEFVEGTLNRV